VQGTSNKANRANLLVTTLVVVLLVAVGVQAYYLYQVRGQLERVLGEAGSAQSVSGVAGAGLPKPALPERSESGKTGGSESDSLLSPFDPDTWDPFQEMAAMRDRMDRLFDESFRRFRFSPRYRDLVRNFYLSPDVDLREEDDQYVVQMDIPGAEEADINVELEGQTLTISGTRTETIEENKPGNFLRRERRTGQFRRSITLPGPVQEASMDVTYKDGVLTVRIKKG